MRDLADVLGMSPVSIQTLGVTRSTAGDNTYNIGAVNMAKSVVLYPTISEIYAASNALPLARLTSASQVLVPKSEGGAALAFTLQVIDFGGLVKSVQRGTATATSVAIGAVNPAKCLCLYGGHVPYAANGNVSCTINAGALAFNAAAASFPIEWQLIEFN